MWRRANKKMKTDEATIKKKRRVFKVQRAVAGVTVDEVRVSAVFGKRCGDLNITFSIL